MLSLFNALLYLLFYLISNPRKDFHFITDVMSKFDSFIKKLFFDRYIKVQFIMGLFIELKQTKISLCEVQV